MSTQGKDDSKLAKAGLIGTSIYLVILAVGIPIGFLCEFLNWRPFSLNELGDFLAGAFGPLAIFWLVLGFFQQSRELKNNVDALNLQSDELKKAAQQQELLAKTNQRIADADDQRRKFEFELDRRKTAIEISSTLVKASQTLPIVKQSRHSRLAFGGQLNSGATAKFDARYGIWLSHHRQLEERFNHVHIENAIDFSESTVQHLAQLYELRTELFQFLEELEASLDEDRFERTLRIHNIRY